MLLYHGELRGRQAGVQTGEASKLLFALPMLGMSIPRPNGPRDVGLATSGRKGHVLLTRSTSEESIDTSAYSCFAICMMTSPVGEMTSEPPSYAIPLASTPILSTVPQLGRAA